MTSPADALAGLSASNARDPHGLVAARLKKEQALLDMKRSLELQAGDPRHTFSGATHTDVADEEQQLADSPNFGTAAQQQTADVQQTNADLTKYNRPDVTAQRTAENATKLAQATVPKVEAAKVSGANDLALDAQKSRTHEEGQKKLLEMLMGGGSDAKGGLPPGTQQSIHISPTEGVSASFTPAAKTDALQERMLNSMNESQPLVARIEKEILGRNGGAPPSTGPLSQLLSKGKNVSQQYLYEHKFSTPGRALQEMEGLLGVLGSSAYVVGSRSYQLILKAMAHLTDGNGTDAFNYGQIQTMKEEWPKMYQRVLDLKLHPDAPLQTGAPSVDPAGIR